MCITWVVVGVRPGEGAEDGLVRRVVLAGPLLGVLGQGLGILNILIGGHWSSLDIKVATHNIT